MGFFLFRNNCLLYDEQKTSYLKPSEDSGSEVSSFGKIFAFSGRSASSQNILKVVVKAYPIKVINRRKVRHGKKK